MGVLFAEDQVEGSLTNSTQNYIVLRRCKFGNWMNWLIFVSEMLNLFYWFINITCNQKIIKTTMMFSVVLVDIDNTQQHDSFQWINICFIIYYSFNYRICIVLKLYNFALNSLKVAWKFFLTLYAFSHFPSYQQRLNV
jgi:hypothetical protein